MRNARLAGAGAGIALAAGLLLSGCGTAPPQDRVVAVTSAASANDATAQTFQTTIGMTPLEAQGIMRLQSFAGDVCVSDSSGYGNVSHCVCQQNDCNCQYTGSRCGP